jgi:CheY-like chemotaxis protein
MNKLVTKWQRIILQIMKVLIVDDNQDTTCMLSEFLKAKGHENIITNDPLAGLDLIKEEHYDAILLDISMPEFSGIDIIDSLEREKILHDQKIIIFSAIAITDSQIKYLLKKDGVEACIKKPIELEKLLTAITS